MNSHPVAFFEGVDDRDAAEELIRAILWIDQDAATAAPEDNAWYDHQLVGLDVVRDGEVVGRVIRVEHFPSQDLLVVRPSTGAGSDTEVLVPFVAAIVPEVDIEARPRRRDPAAGTLRGAARRRRARAGAPRTKRPLADTTTDRGAPLSARPERAEDNPEHVGSARRVAARHRLGRARDRRVLCWPTSGGGTQALSSRRGERR